MEVLPFEMSANKYFIEREHLTVTITQAGLSAALLWSWIRTKAQLSQCPEPRRVRLARDPSLYPPIPDVFLCV